MFELLDWKSWFTAFIIVVMIIALIRGISRPHHIFLIALFSLLLTGIITPFEAVSGFTNNAVLTVGALFIVAAGVQQTRLFTWLEKYLLPQKGGTGRTLLRIMTSASAMSSFLNNTPIVAMFTPQMQQWAQKIGVPVSKLLIPLSYAAIVGGTVTLIGTSTNLIVSEMLSDRGYGAFHLFQLAWIGIPATILVIAWFALIGHRFLPDRTAPLPVEAMDPASESIQREFESNKSTSDNKTTEYGRTPESYPERALLPVHGSGAAGASISGSREPLMDNRIFHGNFAFASPIGGDNWPSGVYSFGNNASRMAETAPIEKSQGRVNGMDGPNRGYGSDQPETAPGKERSKRVLLILTLMIGLSATGILPVHVSVMVAALATLLTGVLPVRQVTKSVNFSVLIVIASALGIGSALESTGLAEVIAFSVIDTTAGFGIIIVLIGLYLLTNLLTELVTNNAAAVLMIPIALSTSLSLGIDPQAVGITVAVAASASFLSPIGYHTNLMVMEPGGYRFTDFFKAGLPVTIILMTVTVSMVTWLWV